ncbi:hypothetical protein [Streptomyces fructofermentans]|uniref:Uncharacterized protein n=1 Tax=Streptomyces fructofermentans TaxID=152141 RepID=A0A918NWG9_9ACTN|nr:hypothetical protein [Streptomyces fructofermentans]GGX99179.1 hypothetical protein GCM10010515_76700 [Streptomyces fructofermentans]
MAHRIDQHQPKHDPLACDLCCTLTEHLAEHPLPLQDQGHVLDDAIGAALDALLGRPSYAQQVLLEAAALLETDPDEPITNCVWEQVLEWAARATFDGLPDAVRSDSLATATAALPPTSDLTHGQYAGLLRSTAARLG